MIWWGVLVFAGNLVTWLWPVYAVHAWVAVDVSGRRRSGRESASFNPSPRPHGAAFDVRLFWRFVLFFAFGYLCTNVSAISARASSARSGRSTSCCSIRSAGLWFGYAFVAIGLGILR